MKKKGSSLITVLIFMMFLMIVGSATVTTTMMDYKARVNESQRIENLYGAESGLEIAYDILLKASDYAIEEALAKTNAEVAKQEKNMNADVDFDVFFKSMYFKILVDSEYEHGIDKLKMTNGLVNELLTNLKYPVLTDSLKLDFIESGFNPIDKDMSITIEIFNKDGLAMTPEDQKTGEFNVKVTAIFKSRDNNTQISDAERKVSRTFSFKIPNYTKSLVSLYPVFNGKALTVDGNVSLTGNASNKVNLSISGDAWIGGNKCVNTSEPCSTDVTNVTYGKYENGILIEDASLEMTGNLATEQTVALRNNATVTINGNIYGRNVYLGKKDVAAISKLSHLRVTTTNDTKYEVVLSNDLAINVDSSDIPNSTVIIDKFYGISNKTVKKNDLPLADGEISLDDVPGLSRESSSILVNAKGASVTINDEAYIGGLAFIDATDSEGNKYQTGESVAVKPNYLAYSKVIDGFEDKVTFRYYNPLMLVETIDGMNKSNYFVNTSGQIEISDGGISLPSKVYSAGATISNGKVSGVQGDDTIGETLRVEKTIIYENYVLHMNGNADSNFDNRTVANQILWTASGFSTPVTVTGEETVILNNTNKKIIISHNGGKYFVKIGDMESKAITNKMLLVTQGDVELQGDVQIIGNLIIGGHIQVKDSVKDGSVTYDHDITKSILTNHATLLDKVFIDSGKLMESVGTTDDQDFSATTIISKGRWELVK